jgi:hypothetical protein
MTAPAKINFKVYQGATFEQVLRWESETKTYAPITAVTKSAPVTISIGDASKLPPVGWRVRVTNVGGMREINMQEGQYVLATGISGNILTINELNSLAYTAYTGGGVLEYNTPVSLAGYTARMQVRKKSKDVDTVLVLTTENGGLVLDDATKTITIKAAAEQTSALDFSQAVYDLEFVSPNGKVLRFAEGNLTLKPEVTR